MFKTRKALFTIILLLLISIIIPMIVYGNSAEPPSILIIVPNAPNSLEITIESNNEYIHANKVDKTIEKYYTFYSRDLRNTENYNFNFDLGESSFEIILDKPLEYYNNIYTLNLENQLLTPGKSIKRTIILVSIRMVMTIIIEAIVFFLFGYRQKKSWGVFLAMNLLTQGALNIWLNKFSPMTSYIIISLILAEILVFIAEMVTFSIFIKEHKGWRTILYVLLANLLSLIAGGYIITILPI